MYSSYTYINCLILINTFNKEVSKDKYLFEKMRKEIFIEYNS